jgi:hypothetical protein
VPTAPTNVLSTGEKSTDRMCRAATRLYEGTSRTASHSFARALCAFFSPPAPRRLGECSVRAKPPASWDPTKPGFGRSTDRECGGWVG